MSQQQPTRSEDAPVLSWEAGGGGRTYIEIDAIPTFKDAHGGTITDFAIQDGASIADHRIRKPQTISFEINQTSVPIEQGVPDVLEESFEDQTIELELPPNRFQAKGLLLAMTALTGLVTSGLGALGVIDVPGVTPFRVNVLRQKDETDRINKLYDEVKKAADSAGRFELVWLGRTWTDLVIESFEYTRTGARLLGVFSLTLKKIEVVKTAQASAVQIPATLAMKLPIQLGSKPAKGYADIESSVTKRSLLSSGPSAGFF